jgi:hypothetical protein
MVSGAVKSKRVGRATLNNGVVTTAYRAVVQHECAQCAGTITPGALFSRRGPRALLTATGATPVPICVTCRPLHLDSAGSGDAD